MRPSHVLLDQIKRQRIRLSAAQPSTGFGERRSRLKGVGLEFAESRPFRDGDDLRNLDPRVSARTGERHVREFFFERRAVVQIVIDTSASMTWRGGDKFALGKLMANLIGFGGLLSGDQVQVVHGSDHGPMQSRWFQGERRSDALFAYVESLKGNGRGVVSNVEDVRHLFRHRALVVLISDFLDERALELPELSVAPNRDLVAVDIVHEDERAPHMRSGSYRLLDREIADHDLAVDLDAATLDLYCEEFTRWKRDIAQSVHHHGGTYLAATTPHRDDPDAIMDILAPFIPARSGRR